MALVKDWVSAFLMRHMLRFPGDWPREEFETAELKRLWLSSLARNEVREDEADAASLRMGEAPPSYRRDHLPMLIANVKVLRCEAGVGAHEAEKRESARLASMDCPRCHGEGITVAWHPRPDPTNRVPRTVPAWCACRAGRWVMRSHKTHRDTQDVYQGFVDLQAVLDGASGWLIDDPALPDHFRRPEAAR